MVGGAIPGLVAVGSIRKQAEVAMESKLVSRTPPQFLHQPLPPDSFPVRVPALVGFDDDLLYGPVTEINPLVWSGCFITALVTLKQSSVVYVVVCVNVFN